MRTKHYAIATQALHYMLTDQTMAITHELGWERKGFPIPIKRMPPNPDGTTTQEYRPFAVLEYVHEQINSEAAAKLALARQATKEAA